MDEAVFRANQLNDSNDILEICLCGQFAVRTVRGVELTPKGRKACAVIVLLAGCDTNKRARHWIEQTLWSDRGAEQAQGSLRQTLFDLRKQLGSFSNVLLSNRNSVWLDRERVHIVQPEKGGEFLEGLDVNDPMFRKWLSKKRLAYASNTQRALDTARVVNIQCGDTVNVKGASVAGAHILNDQVGGIISGFLARSTRGVLDSPADLIVRASLEELSKCTVIEVQIIDARRDVLIHSDYSVVEDPITLLGDGIEMSRFCWKVADVALDRLAVSHRETDPVSTRAAWAQEAIGAVLTFDYKVMPRSLEILSEATGIIQDGLLYALQAWSMMLLIMEEHLEETSESLAAVGAALEQARCLAPDEPMVNGICANVQAVLFENYSEAFKLAALVLKIQPFNIFATQAMSLCQCHMGLHEEAYVLSRRNQAIAEFTKFGAMCNLHHALLCLKTHRSDEALECAIAASGATPNILAPNRYLVALYATVGQLDDASTQEAELSMIEPEYIIHRLIKDERYPVNTLRNPGTLAGAKGKLSGEFWR